MARHTCRGCRRRRVNHSVYKTCWKCRARYKERLIKLATEGRL